MWLHRNYPATVFPSLSGDMTRIVSNYGDMLISSQVYHPNVIFYLHRDCIRMKTYWCRAAMESRLSGCAVPNEQVIRPSAKMMELEKGGLYGHGIDVYRQERVRVLLG